MEIIERATLNKSMIILARESRGLSQRELAEKIKMSATNLSKIERGDINISETLIENIAEATFYPIHFFYRTESIIPENLIYRKRQTVSQKLIIPIHAQSNIYRSHVQFLTRIQRTNNTSFPAMPVTPGNSPAAIAIKLRRKWNITEPVIPNMIQLIEQNNISIVSFNFGTERIDSLSMLTDDKHPIIFLNKKLLGDKLRFSAAYELAKLIMHTFNNVPLDRDISREANAFAAEFLMPSREIKKDFEGGISIPLLASLKKKWKVSMIALLYRADDLGFLSPNQKRYLLQQFNTLNIRRREPMELDVEIEEPKLIKKWIANYRNKKKLGLAEMATLFYLHPDEFMELYS